MKNKKISYLANSIIGIIILLIIINLAFNSISIMAQITTIEKRSTEPGFQYADLKDQLKNETIVGFLSEKNQTPEGNDGGFMMAQYMLAPILLDLDNPDHKINIIDASTPDAAKSILSIIRAKPVYISPFGKIIAERF
ncbi:MAG: hypothetical protein PHY73_07920 [Candidatus Omnitrophica bacterium]|nr:hypothetical protein [Candidatus Omnitrophota bacterium]